MIDRQKFVMAVLDNVARVTHYELGEDGRSGGCDCIGLIIGALRMAGEKWTGTHGSNYAARNEMQGLWRLEDAADLIPGMVVYKSKTRNQDGYALPDKYKSGSDLNDYYHVGVVTMVNPLEITHCTGVQGGIKRDSNTKGWTHYGTLKKVDTNEQEAVKTVGNKTMYVVSSNGKPVKLRMNANKNSGWYSELPVGTTVEALPYESDTWYKVKHENVTGYMMKEFLSENAPVHDDAGTDIESDVGSVTLVLEKSVAHKLLKALEEVL